MHDGVVYEWDPYQCVDMMDFAIHHLDIYEILASMNGRRIVSEGVGWHDITERANMVCGPHSLEWGQYVYELQFIYEASSG